MEKQKLWTPAARGCPHSARHRGGIGIGLAAVLAGMMLGRAEAQTASSPGAETSPPAQAGTPPAASTETSAATTSSAPGETGFFTGLFSPSRSNLLGDMGGLRSFLGNYGISLGLSEISEVLGNVTGGVHQGFDYDGVTIMSMGLDTQKAFGWDGGIFNVSALQIHGRDLTTDNLYVLQLASSIEAEDTTRLWELWFQQSFFAGKMDLKIGQQSIDQEFMVDPYSSALFINAVMGWPALPTVDFYAGGPAYPLSSLGVRLRAQPTNNITVLAGVFDDNPPGGPFNNDSQLRGAEAAGLAFNLNTGALWIAEIQYALNQPAVGDMVSPNTPPPGLPGVYKLGFWYDSGAFPDQRFDTRGISLASSASNGIPFMHQGNWGVYALGDQMIWQPDPKGPQWLGVFARAMAAPPDRNLVSFSADAGLVLKAPFSGRDNDTAGIGFGVAKISSAAAALDTDIAFYTKSNYPERTAETFIEATYQVQIAPWWQVQPDFQYFIRPAGGIPNPLQPGKVIGNEFVLGVRTNVVF
ncbi:MAG: carbohydrate porin [Acetobacteraceae bacterium]|nr:carbohydrate porin [Acetobacteraceae bacterium]